MHRGFNDVNNKTPTPEKITNGIADMGILFRDYGLNDIFISTMICSRGKFLNEKIKHVNFLLKLICEENWYIFIENKNTEIRDISIYHMYISYIHMYICIYDIHLLEAGKTKLGESFLYFLNNSYWLFPYNNFLEAYTHVNIEHTYSEHNCRTQWTVNQPQLREF